MSIERVPQQQIPTVEALREIPFDQRLHMIETAMLDIKAKVATICNIIASLEEDGYDTTHLRRRKMIQFISQVHQGLLLPEAFQAFLSAYYMLRCFAALPIEEQKRLMEAGTVQVVEMVDGQTTHRIVGLEELSEQEAKLVFDVHNRKVRSVEEQAHERFSTRIKTDLKMTPRLKHDPETGIIESYGVTFKQIAAYAKKHGIDKW